MKNSILKTILWIPSALIGLAAWAMPVQPGNYSCSYAYEVQDGKSRIMESGKTSDVLVQTNDKKMSITHPQLASLGEIIMSCENRRRLLDGGESTILEELQCTSEKIVQRLQVQVVGKQEEETQERVMRIQGDLIQLKISDFSKQGARKNHRLANLECRKQP